MNERIRELAEQARKYARDYVAECKHYGHYMEHNEYELRFEEKFAELIIKKCISQIALIGISNFENEDISWTVETAIANIQEHFGVKE